MALHIASLWNRGFVKLGNGLLVLFASIAGAEVTRNFTLKQDIGQRNNKIWRLKE